MQQLRRFIFNLGSSDVPKHRCTAPGTRNTLSYQRSAAPNRIQEVKKRRKDRKHLAQLAVSHKGPPKKSKVGILVDPRQVPQLHTQYKSITTTPIPSSGILNFHGSSNGLGNSTLVSCKRHESNSFNVILQKAFGSLLGSVVVVAPTKRVEPRNFY